jgi:hypothetical protein
LDTVLPLLFAYLSYAQRNRRLCMFINWCFLLCLMQRSARVSARPNPCTPPCRKYGFTELMDQKSFMRKKEKGHMTVFRVDLVPTPAISLDLCYWIAVLR